MLRQLVSALCKLCLRHEDALNLHSLDTRLILFCSKHEGKVSMSLRVTMAMYIPGQIKQQAEALHLRALTEELEEPESIWLTKNQWSYLTWDAQSKKHMVPTPSRWSKDRSSGPSTASTSSSRSRTCFTAFIRCGLSPKSWMLVCGRRPPRRPKLSSGR